jgi:RNA 3'-terminal phosphate cyclase (ATP)
LLAYLQRFVEKIELKIIKRGYYPKGQGKIQLEICPRFKLNNFTIHQLLEELEYKCPKIILMNQGKLEQIRGVVNASSQLEDKDVNRRIAMAAKNALKEFDVPVNIREEYCEASSLGGEILLWAIFSNGGKVDYDNPIIISSDTLIEKTKSSPEIGIEVATKLKKEINTNAATDPHLADMLIPFMGILPKSSIKVSTITDHTKTNIYVTEKILDVGFKIEKDLISVESI